jgi:MurNAc alpha-1-phosphate uridylyltransferase
MLKSFSAMILAAGYGRRMLSLTKDIPKPLVKVHNVSLLKNCIDFLLKIGCEEIIINTHYKHNLISDFINQFYTTLNIKISYEKNILDTAGGVKNAAQLFDYKDVLVTNSDIFWKEENKKDVINLISNYNSKDECRLLLVEKDRAYGIINKAGDFSLDKNFVKRWKTSDKVIYYSGLQMIALDIIKDYNSTVFSFNEVWDCQIKKRKLYGNLMSSNCYHVGNLTGLNYVKNSTT